MIKSSFNFASSLLIHANKKFVNTYIATYELWRSLYDIAPVIHWSCKAMYVYNNQANNFWVASNF